HAGDVERTFGSEFDDTCGLCSGVEVASEVGIERLTCSHRECSESRSSGVEVTDECAACSSTGYGAGIDCEAVICVRTDVSTRVEGHDITGHGAAGRAEVSGEGYVAGSVGCDRVN